MGLLWAKGNSDLLDYHATKGEVIVDFSPVKNDISPLQNSFQLTQDFELQYDFNSEIDFVHFLVKTNN